MPGTGGTFTLPPESTIEEAAATTVLAGSELVIDVQTHLLEYEPGTGDGLGTRLPAGLVRRRPGGVPRDRRLARPRPRRQRHRGRRAVGDPRRRRPRSAVDGGDGARPPPGRTARLRRPRADPGSRDADDRSRCRPRSTRWPRPRPTFEIAAWKAYTHEGPSWRLDDDIGNAFCDQVRALGQRIICVHKGLGPAAASPVDVGPAAANHPDLTFCIYHSGFEAAVTEGEYPGDEAGAAAGGVDRLIASVHGAGIGPGGNVYAELGSTWWNLIQRPDEAAHVLGKLLVALGPDNILWGTDSIWYGSPQGQIEAFRAFEITPEYQERYGYPALTADVKARILGLNAARVYGIDPATTTCALSACRPLRPARRGARPRPDGPDHGRRRASDVRRRPSLVRVSPDSSQLSSRPPHTASIQPRRPLASYRCAQRRVGNGATGLGVRIVHVHERVSGRTATADVGSVCPRGALGMSHDVATARRRGM